MEGRLQYNKGNEVVNNKSNKGEIMHNATVVYTDNVKVTFEALRVIDKGAIIGRIIDGEFFDCGFISKRNIREIKNGTKRGITKKRS